MTCKADLTQGTAYPGKALPNLITLYGAHHGRVDEGKTMRVWRSSGWRVAVAVIVACIAIWGGLNHFDKALGQARDFVVEAPDIRQRLGRVGGTTLYKLRYVDGADQGTHCFAEYYFFVTGDGSGLQNLRVTACGDRGSPTFLWDQR